MLDDLLDSLDEMKQAIDIEPIVTRQKAADPPKKTPANLLGYEYGMHSYIRSIREIGRFLSPAKPHWTSDGTAADPPTWSPSAKVCAWRMDGAGSGSDPVGRNLPSSGVHP